MHGAWHGSWCWEKVRAGLAATGWAVETVDLPSVAELGRPRHGLYDDAQAVRERLARISGAVVVVAHFSGGVVVTEGVADASNVRHVAYLTAFQLRRMFLDGVRESPVRCTRTSLTTYRTTGQPCQP